MKKFIAICFAFITLFAFSGGVAKADVSPQKHESGIVCDVGFAKVDLSQIFAEVNSPVFFDLYGNEVRYSSPAMFLKTQATNLKSSVWKPDNWQISDDYVYSYFHYKYKKSGKRNNYNRADTRNVRFKHRCSRNC
jgi:hypothetical protein